MDYSHQMMQDTVSQNITNLSNPSIDPNDPNIVYAQPAMVQTPQVPIVPSSSPNSSYYQQQYYSYPNQTGNEYNYQQHSQDHQPSYSRKQYIRGLNAFQVTLFTHFNPQAAIFIVNLNPKTNDILFEMAPAFPNNDAIGLKGPVPANTKVYDYDKKIVSSIRHHEVAQIINLLRTKFEPNFSDYIRLCESNKNSIDLVTKVFQTYFANPQYQNADNQQLMKVCIEILGQLSQMNQYNQHLLDDVRAKQLSKSPDQVGLYRKASNIEDRAWNFNYFPDKHMLYLNVMINKDKNRRYNLGFSKDAALEFLSVLDSYYSNYVTNAVVAELTSQLSQTLAKNNFLAPTKTDQAMNYA